jgi:hypothetical protein
MTTGRVYISRDVVFDENIFNFASLRPNAGPLLRKEILLLPSSMLHEGANIDDHTPIVPITNVPQVAANAQENFQENDGEMAPENAFEILQENDEIYTDFETDPAADSLEHSSTASNSEVEALDADSPAVGEHAGASGQTGRSPSMRADHAPSPRPAAPRAG